MDALALFLFLASFCNISVLFFNLTLAFVWLLHACICMYVCMYDV